MRLRSKFVVLAGTTVPGTCPAVAFGTAGGHPKQQAGG